MIQIEEHSHSLSHNGMRPLALDIYNKSDTARILFKLWVVQTLFGRKSGREQRGLPCLNTFAIQLAFFSL